MANKLDPRIETHHNSRSGNTYLLIMLVWGITSSASARTAEPLLEGVKGWWYYKSLNEAGYVRTAEEACRLNAWNHFGATLRAIIPSKLPKPIYECYYANSFGGHVSDYGHTRLHCEDGYVPQAPGMCVKRAEAPRPPDCSPGQSGVTVANTVALASGARIQTETDFAGTPSGNLRITRTYRSMRAGGSGQSAGQGWSFSFDRNFALIDSIYPKSPPAGVTGTFGDGAFLEFYRLSSGLYKSRIDKRETLRNLTPAFDDWLLTRRDGTLERFKKTNGQFLLISSHTKEGVAQLYTYGVDNKLSTIADASGRTLQVTWAGEAVASITGATGSVSYGYDSVKSDDGTAIGGTELLATVDYHASGEAPRAARRYHYDDPNYRHLLTGVTDEKGVRFATYAYNASGQAAMSEHAGGVNRYAFAYPEESKRILIDPLGTRREFELTYKSVGSLVLSVSQPGGAGCGPGSSDFTYDDLGKPSSSTDFNEKKTCFINESARGLVTSEVSGLSASDACPASGTEAIPTNVRRISRQWHPDVEAESAIASAGQITRYVYNGQPDANASVASCADGATLPDGKPIVVLCSKTIQATRDANGAAGFAAQPVGRARTWRYSYNTSGQLLKQTGPMDAVGQAETVTNVYFDDTTANHAKGDLASTQNATGEVTKYLAYTKDGMPSRVQRADGMTVSLTYGARQRITSSTLVNGKGDTETTRYSHDSVGQLTGMVSPDGSAVTLAYDDAQRLTDLGDSTGNRLKLTLDNMGNVTRQELRNPSGAVVQSSNQVFDALDRLASYQRGMQTPTTYQYDRAGNLTAIRDALGRATTAEYDRLDRMTKTTLPAPAWGKSATTIGFGYDHQDSVVSVTDPRKLTTRYAIDGYGQLASLSSPDTNTSVFEFDDAGSLVSGRDARGVTTGYRHDAAQRLIKSGSSTFEYGKHGTSAAGQLTAMSDESGNSTFTYDGFGRLQAQLQTVRTGTAAKQFALEYKYGTSGPDTGHVTSMTYPSGNRIAVAYGAGGRAVSLSLYAPGSTAAITIMANVRYTPFGAVQSWNWGNPARSTPYKREFDGDGRLKSYPLGVIGSNGTLRTLNYDAVDRIKSVAHTGAANAARLDQSYTYDDLDRLTRVDGASVSQAFDYDANGNRIQARFGAGTYTNTFQSTSNRLMSTTGPIPAKTNAYDNAGNLTSDGTAKYTYGTNGRMTSVVAAGATTRYRYNGFGERVEKVGAAGNVTYYVYDVAGRLIGEYDQAGKAIQETVYLGDLPVAVLKPSAVPASPAAPLTDVYSVYADHIITPRAITRLSDQRMVWRWDNADPFGLQQPDESPSGLPKFTYNPRFPGQVFDKETNNHYNYLRDYDPQTGRYIQSDPIGLVGGINTYAYVRGNPLTYIDPAGLADMNLFGAGDANMQKGADAWNVRGAYTVAGHGNQFFIQGPNMERFYPEALATMIRKDPNYKGQTIILGACYSARDRQDGKPGLAEQLSNLMNRRVIGSSEAVWYSASGMHGSGVSRPRGGDTGPWTTKLPGGR